MRRAFAETLLKAAAADPRVVLVTGDLGFQVFDEFRLRHGARFINAGVAEAQVINVAAGLAAEGWRPIAYSIASFLTARPYEQIRYCVAYPNLPVTLIGAGRGLTYSTSGVSHHALDDIALMSLLPNMTVAIPGDPTELEQLLPQALRLPGPAYLTVGRFGEPRYAAPEPAILGHARLLQRGERLAVLTTGEIAGEALSALDRLRTEGVTPVLYQFHTVKPLDTVTLENLATWAEAMLVVEEHLPNGGLWSAVASWRASSHRAIRLARLGPDDAFALGNCRREVFRRRMGCDAEAIAAACRKLWRQTDEAAGGRAQTVLAPPIHRCARGLGEHPLAGELLVA